MNSVLAALLTGPGRSAIAVIGVRGEGAFDIIDRFFTPVTQRAFKVGEIRYGTWASNHGLHSKSPGESTINPVGESVVVVPIDEMQFEVHCHGGRAAIDRIQGDLKAAGVRVVDANDQAWTGSKPLLICEAEKALQGCTTDRFAAIAMDQVRGAMNRWCDHLLTEFDSGKRTLNEATTEARQVQRYGRIGMHLTTQYRVVFAGPPNVGKSSLINAIVGYDRSITMDAPGTTRDVLHASTVIDGIPLRLSDTAGIRDSSNEIESQGMERAKSVISDADLVVWVVQPDSGKMPERPEFDPNREIVVLNKADLLSDSTKSSRWIQTVATSGEGIDLLMSQIARTLIPELPERGHPVPVNERQVEWLSKIALASDSAEFRRLVRRLQAG